MTDVSPRSSSAAEDEIDQMDFEELLDRAEAFRQSTVIKSVDTGMGSFLKDETEAEEDSHKKKGWFAGVFVPTCENMWGVLIFLRFYFIVGHAGVGEALGAVVLSFVAAFCTTSSMCAIAESGGFVSQGGPYFMISRALGPAFGATVGIMYWLAIILLCVLEALGAVEALLMAAPSLAFNGSPQAYGSCLMVIMAIWVWCGINFVTKLGVFFIFVVFSTLVSFYVGLCTAPLSDAAKNNPWITGLSLTTLKNNIGPHYGVDSHGDRVDFGRVLSVFYPCFTGILSGANRASVLKNPARSIRVGTYNAIIFSFIMYSSFMVLWGSVADHRYLQGKTYSESSDRRRLAGGSEGSQIVEEITWNPFPHMAAIGIIISSISQALQCLIVAPRLLQSISADEIIKIMTPLAPVSAKNEPHRALAVTYIVAALLVLTGQLDTIAPLLTMCFLVAYSCMNLSCLVLTWLRSATWRPKGIHKRRWRLWYEGVGGTGVFVSLVIMFTVDIYWATGALGLSACLFSYIRYKTASKDWGSAVDGIRFRLALKSLLRIEGQDEQVVNWRPQVLVLHKLRLSQEFKHKGSSDILKLCSQMNKALAFCIVGCICEGSCMDEHVMKKAKISVGVVKAIMERDGVVGFADVVASPSWFEGASYLLQLSGIGGLKPNTVLMDWPEPWEDDVPDTAVDFAKIIRISLSFKKAVFLVKSVKPFPSMSVLGTIDIWWFTDDGGFLLAMAWILLRDNVWRKCQIRLFTICESDNPEEQDRIENSLKGVLAAQRISNVSVEAVPVERNKIVPFKKELTDPDQTIRHRIIPKDVGQLVTGSMPTMTPRTMRRTYESSASVLSRVIQSRSAGAQLVVMNLPDSASVDTSEDCVKFIRYCEALVEGLDRVLFVDSAGHGIFTTR